MGMFDEFHWGKMSWQSKALACNLSRYHQYDSIEHVYGYPDLFQINAIGGNNLMATDKYWLLISRGRFTGYSKVGFNVATWCHDYTSGLILESPYCGVPLELGYV